MWKLDFFLLPSKDYRGMNEEEVYEFGERIDLLKKAENVYVPNEFYETADCNDIKAFDFLYGGGQNDISDYLSEIISKQRVCPDTYDEIRERAEYGYVPISSNDVSEEIAQICAINVEDREEEKCVCVSDILQIKRFYLKKADAYKVFIDRVRDCFPALVFHGEAFQNVEKLGKCTDVAEELIRHLSVLNDVAKKTYDYHRKNERAALAELKAGYNIECSGKGSNEEKTYNKEMTYGGRKYQLTCNPHTKLYHKRTDQRIYFCWGRDEIEGHRIIIVRVGPHWQE